MRNPFRSFKYLPWFGLLQSAALTVLVATAIDILLLLAIVEVPAVASVLSAARILLVILPFAAAFGIGALSIFLTANFFRQVLLGSDTIWALVACVLLLLLLKSWLPIPALFVSGFSYFNLIGVVVGAFTQGRRYWR
ncbi:hypothetical protein BH23CYA1_BH23CYA1_01120 [soil metagenome]|uniref:peptide chain release factor 1 n=1 Tax=Leptolyngbya sp. BC1307 TaxID=2029589 RepID=UPI000EFBC4F8|nr:peptide chain release factor 1 [Leptolyngbya sp. BC1307]